MTNLDTSALLEELAKHRRPSSIVVVRHRGCGCQVGRVFQLTSGDLLLLDRRKVGAEEVEAVRLDGEADLDQVVASCKHRKQATLDLSALRTHVELVASGRARRNVPFLLS